MKVLITGVTGSGGSYLAEFLAKNDLKLDIYGTTRSHNIDENKNLSRVRGGIHASVVDLSDFGQVYRYLLDVRPEIIFHIASMANVSYSFENPSGVINNNINITLVLLETIRTLKDSYGYNPIVQICSTSEVYGNPAPENIPINENCPLLPINPYAVSKLAQDNLGYVYFLNYGLQIIRTRMFSYFNAKRPNLFATNFAKQIIEIKSGTKKILSHGNLESTRTMIDVRDAAQSYWIAATKGRVGEVYNIGGVERVTVGEILNKLITKGGVEIKRELAKNLLRPSDISIQVPDITKFSNETGWKPKYNLVESLDFFWEEAVEFWGVIK